MNDDEGVAPTPSWVPARPAAGRFAVPDDEPGVSAPSAPLADPVRVREPLRRVRAAPARRRGPATRVARAYLALVLAIAVVVTVGAATQPSYGTLAPFGGTAVGELREAPTTTGWSADLAARFEPDAQKGCLGVHAGEVDAGHELVTATLSGANPDGTGAPCGARGTAVTGVLVMVDPATGQTIWTRDLGAEFGMTVFSLVWHRAPTLGAVVVGVIGSRGSRFVTVDTRTGRTRDSAPVDSSDAATDFAVEGALVLTAVPQIGGSVETYTLRRITDLGTTLWSQQVSAATLPQLLPDRLLVPLPSGTIAVDGKTGRITEWATDLRGIQGARGVDGGILGVTIPQGVGLGSFVVKLDARGRTIWEVPALAVSSLGTSRSCITMTSVRQKLTCLDPLTGTPRWSVDFRGAAAGTPLGSTTADVEAIAQVGVGDTTLRVSSVDGDTGRIRFTTTVSRGAEIVAESTGTGYALDASGPSGRSTLTGFDLSSGRTLWTVTAPRIERWGGRFVTVDDDGVARELVAPISGAHDMLVG